MGHYDEYYEEEAREARERRQASLKVALEDLRKFRSYNGHSPGWNFGSIGCEDLYKRIIERVCAQLYQG